MTIDIDTARAAVKADGDDDELVMRYLNGARGICQGYCNRNFYDTQEEADADFMAALTELQDAENARYALLESVTTVTQKHAVRSRYAEIIGRIKQRINGIVVDDLIEAAILMTLANLYFNREDSTQVPQRAARVLQPYLWIGDLADDEEGGS